MEAKWQQMIDNEAITLEEDDSNDITQLVNEVLPAFKIQKTFWEEQVKYNSLREKRSMIDIATRFPLNLK